MTLRPDDILDLWFGAGAERDTPQQRWFKPDPAFDALLRERFGAEIVRATAGALDSWTVEPQSALALILLLDQVPRNIYRDDPRAFVSDAKARELARLAIKRAYDAALPPVWRWFVYLPFEHSEDAIDQKRSMTLFAALPADPVHDEPKDYARRHQEIIERFGRFPHRNAALDRDSTPEEIEFLKQPGSSF